MALNIKNARVHDLAREAARRTGSSQTSAIEVALERYLAELAKARPPRRLDEILDAAAAMSAKLSAHERRAILDGFDELYDESGLPR